MASSHSGSFSLTRFGATSSRTVICRGRAVPLSPVVRDRDDGVVPLLSTSHVPLLQPCVAKQPGVQRQPSAARHHSKRRKEVTKALDREDVEAAIESLLRYCFSYSFVSLNITPRMSLFCLPTAFPQWRHCRLQRDLTVPTSTPDVQWKESQVSESQWGLHRRTPKHDGIGMAAIAYDLREASAERANELANAMGGLHARVFRLCLRERHPQAALNYAAILPRSEKLHGSLMNEIAKHGTPELIHVALELREKLAIPMDKCVHIPEVPAGPAGQRHTRMHSFWTHNTSMQVHAI